MLDAVGVPAGEWRAYQLLLRLVDATVAELAAHLDLPTAEVQDALAGLIRRGAVHRAGDHRYQAVPPELAFGAELRRRRGELELAAEVVERLGAEYRNRLALRGAGDLIEVVFGDKIGPRLQEIQRGASEEVRTLVKLPIFALSGAENTAGLEALARGVVYRTIYPRSVLELADDPFGLAVSVAAGETARLVDETPLKLIVVDRSVAVVPVLPVTDTEPSALLVYPSGLLDALLALFDAMWAAATPLLVSDGEVHSGPAEGPSASDLHLLSLLLAGLTDQAIAAQLGLSMRTVQRRVHTLVEMAGVRTRLQLIWQAAHRGWI